MAIYLNGMQTDEIVALTLAMRDSGTVLNWQGKLNGPVVDKHSTGGVGDKVTLMLAPMVAACGAYMPSIAGRGLGHTGGTVDKLETIPGYSCTQPLEKIQQLLPQLGATDPLVSIQLSQADAPLFNGIRHIQQIPLQFDAALPSGRVQFNGRQQLHQLDFQQRLEQAMLPVRRQLLGDDA